MFTREKFCAVCGCHFSLPDIRDPVNPDPNEDPMLPFGDPYDSRLLPRKMTEWLTDFRVVGRCENIDPSLVNVSAVPNFFMSEPAEWWNGQGAGEPSVPTITGKAVKVTVYEPNDDTGQGMFSPIHKACLDIIQRLCQSRQVQNQASDFETPGSLEAFCDALRQRRWRNATKPDKTIWEDRYYANFGGIEWPHGYYGARKFWADEWNTALGWELLCADFSAMKIPDLFSYLSSELPKSSSPPTAPETLRRHLVERVGWLFPEEVDMIISNDTRHVEWEKDIPLLLEKADMMSADEGGEESEKKKLASAPIGLKNRWRIWKILQGIQVDPEVYC